MVSIRTGAWYGDHEVDLDMPDTWQVDVARPETPCPLSDEQIVNALEHPIDQPPIRELVRGKSRPMIIVDDLTRPTPAARILPFVLDQVQQGGIAQSNVTILLATGTHGPPPGDALSRKLGERAAASCRVLVHDDRHNLATVGRTSFGSRLVVNRELLASDQLIGIGGIYPQHSTGFGGGSKLLLGAMGRQTIVALHYGHPSMDGSYCTDNDFRRDLDEMARLVGFETLITAHLDANREVVRLVCGNHFKYYEESVRFSREAYRAPLPGDADVVVANAYPMDVSLTFMRSKGIIPLQHARPGASRVVVASCSEGIGLHGLFPFMSQSRLQRPRHLARTIAVGDRRALAGRAVRRLFSKSASATTAEHTNPIWLYVPAEAAGRLPDCIPGMTALYSWSDVIQRLEAEQRALPRVRALVYACAPLQVLGPT
jgi:nickel-dependent lactate racemase